MSHRWDCMDTYEAERLGRSRADRDAESGHRSNRLPYDVEGCSEAEDAYRRAYEREYRSEQYRIEERQEEEREERRRAEWRAEEQRQLDEYYRQQEEEKAEYYRQMEAAAEDETGPQ